MKALWSMLLLAAMAASLVTLPGDACAAPTPKATTTEVDVDGKVPATITVKVGERLDFTRIFPNSLKMVFVETDNSSVLEDVWVPLIKPRTQLPMKIVIKRFDAKQAGTAKVTITYEDGNGTKTTKIITVTVR